jgi:hypothetical protein
MPHCIILLFIFHLNAILYLPLFSLGPAHSFFHFLFPFSPLPPARPNWPACSASPSAAQPARSFLLPFFLSLMARTHLPRSSPTLSQTESGHDTARPPPLRAAHASTPRPRGRPIKPPPRALGSAHHAAAAFCFMNPSRAAAFAAKLRDTAVSPLCHRFVAPARYRSSAWRWASSPALFPFVFPLARARNASLELRDRASPLSAFLSPDASSQPLKCVPLLALFLLGQTRVETVARVVFTRFTDKPSPPAAVNPRHRRQRCRPRSCLIGLVLDQSQIIR